MSAFQTDRRYVGGWLHLSTLTMDYAAVAAAVCKHAADLEPPTQLVWWSSQTRRAKFTVKKLRELFVDTTVVNVSLSSANTNRSHQHYSLRPTSPDLSPSYVIRNISVHSLNGDNAIRRLIDFYRELCEILPVAQGFVGSFDRPDYSGCEQLSGSFTPQDLDPETKARLHEDNLLVGSFPTKLRRIYPLTIVGGMIAEQVLPLLPASDATGFPVVTPFGHCSLIRFSETLGGPRDPEFLDRTREVRRRLWPHTIQNPADALELDVPSSPLA